MNRGSGGSGAPRGDFQAFTASSLFCARCNQARPVRESLLLVLPDGNLFDYRCAVCGASLGTRKVTGPGEGFSGGRRQ